MGMRKIDCTQFKRASTVCVWRPNRVSMALIDEIIAEDGMTHDDR
jgi:hypothetical protein